jgi:hypothetical protein
VGGFFHSQVRARAYADVHQCLVLAAQRQQHPQGRVERRQLDQYGRLGNPDRVLPKHAVRHQQQICTLEHHHQPDVL